MQQKVFLIGEIYLFCIYFSLDNFNYPNKKLAIPSKLRNSATFPRKKNKTKLSSVLGAGQGCGLAGIDRGIPQPPHPSRASQHLLSRRCTPQNWLGGPSRRSWGRGGGWHLLGDDFQDHYHQGGHRRHHNRRLCSFLADEGSLISFHHYHFHRSHLSIKLYVINGLPGLAKELDDVCFQNT